MPYSLVNSGVVFRITFSFISIQCVTKGSRGHFYATASLLDAVLSNEVETSSLIDFFNVSFKTFTATWFNTVFSGHQPRQMITSHRDLAAKIENNSINNLPTDSNWLVHAEPFWYSLPRQVYEYKHRIDECWVISVLPEDGDEASPRNVASFKSPDVADGPRRLY